MRNGEWQRCCQCKTDMWLPEALEIAARASEKIWFFCPYGHEQHYSKQETEADKLRRERDRLAQLIAERDDRIRGLSELRLAAERQAAAARGQVTRLKKRAAAAMCPCCNRTFTALRRHMAAKHPGFVAEPIDGDKIVPIRRPA